MFLKIKTYKAKFMFSWLLIIAILFVGSSLVLAEEKSQDIQKIESKEVVRNTSKEKVEKQINEIIEKQIDEEIKTYKNRAKDVFEFDDTLIEKIDKKILCLSLMKLNYLFDKYQRFTKVFIYFKRKEQTKFKLQVGTDMKDETIMSVCMDCLNFSVKNLSNYEKCIGQEFWDNSTSFHSSCSASNYVESSITHEFGHLIEFMYCNSDIEIQHKRGEWLCKSEEMKRKFKDQERIPKEYDRLCKEVKRLLDEYSRLLDETCVRIKNRILEDLKGKDRNISTYGGTNAKEFFAEAFAHLECTDNPDDVNEIGRRLENYLVNVMEYLPRENSKFNK